MDKHVLATIFRRWIAGQSISRINELEGFDRKTVRAYIRGFEAHGYHPGRENVDPDRLDSVFDALLPNNRRRRGKREQLEPYREELIRLVSPPESREDAVKPKTAYLILVEKYGLEVSYETFKLYAKEIGLAAQRTRAPTLLEQPPRAETQIDYGSVGTLADQRRGTNRCVHAFAAKLSCSRLPYIQFVFSQDTSSGEGM
jgi:hypothetical protein